MGLSGIGLRRSNKILITQRPIPLGFKRHLRGACIACVYFVQQRQSVFQKALFSRQLGRQCATEILLVQNPMGEAKRRQEIAVKEFLDPMLVDTPGGRIYVQ